MTGISGLFEKGAYVKVLLDVTNGYAYIQNADTNAYLEEALNSKAPANFGRRGTALNDDQFMRIIIDCLDEMDKDSVRHVSIYQNGLHSVTIHKHDDTRATIEDTYFVVRGSATDYAKRFRHMSSGSWLPWEYLSPLMVNRVVYRTTERYNGDPVYTCRVYFNDLCADAAGGYEVISLGNLVCDDSAVADKLSRGQVTVIDYHGIVSLDGIDFTRFPMHEGDNYYCNAIVDFGNGGLMIATKGFEYGWGHVTFKFTTGNL